MRKLTLEEIMNITCGAVSVFENGGVTKFRRFTEEQENFYLTNRSESLYKKSLASAGIKLCFETDSEELRLYFGTDKGSSREYYSVDVFVNGKAVKFIDNFSGRTLPEKYTAEHFESADKDETFSIGNGIKKVEIHLPWSAEFLLKELSVSDGAYVKPIKKTKKLLSFGDSITQGYDALRPSNRYVSLLAEKLDAEELNKGIGGEIFVPQLAMLKDSFNPDYITVAYGTNDWSVATESELISNCSNFYRNLSINYPDAKIFAITPIWRAEYEIDRKSGAFRDIEKHIANAVKDLANVTVICGFDLVEKNYKLFGDLSLHPNDEGFIQYAENLYKKVSEYL